MAEFQSISSRQKAVIDAKEYELIRKGYSRVSQHQELQPLQYHRSDYTGTADSFEGPRSYRIDWRELD